MRKLKRNRLTVNRETLRYLSGGDVQPEMLKETDYGSCAISGTGCPGPGTSGVRTVC